MEQGEGFSGSSHPDKEEKLRQSTITNSVMFLQHFSAMAANYKTLFLSSESVTRERKLLTHSRGFHCVRHPSQRRGWSGLVSEENQ